jgi:hypothetical protein
MKDPIIQEIRKIRHELDDKLVKTPKEFDRDIESIRNRYSKNIVTRQVKQKKLKAA